MAEVMNTDLSQFRFVEGLLENALIQNGRVEWIALLIIEEPRRPLFPAFLQRAPFLLHQMAVPPVGWCHPGNIKEKNLRATRGGTGSHEVQQNGRSSDALLLPRIRIYGDQPSRATNRRQPRDTLPQPLIAGLVRALTPFVAM